MTLENEKQEFSLQEVINKKRSESKVPAASRQIMDESIVNLAKTDLVKNALKVGDLYVDFELPNIDGKLIKLSEKLKNGPIILTFYRGGWCPYCNLQLRSYQEHIKSFQQFDAQIIAVSPESIESTNSTVNRNEIKFEVLTDDLNNKARKYGIVFKLDDKLISVYKNSPTDLVKSQGNDQWELPLPATYVINKEGRIIYSFLDADYLKRSEPKDIINALKKTK